MADGLELQRLSDGSGDVCLAVEEFTGVFI